MIIVASEEVDVTGKRNANKVGKNCYKKVNNENGASDNYNLFNERTLEEGWQEIVLLKAKIV